MAKIGFVGLGHMGSPMAINLLNAGFELSVYDINAAALEQLASKGASISPNLNELSQKSDILITMLQTGQQVSQVCLNEQGLFHFAKPGTLFIDCSSIDVPTSREIHQHATQSGLLAIDAPVSGGVKGAQMATLTFMVGGEDEAFVKAQNILKHMGKNIVHTGGAGTGQAAKICNNMILGISMLAISESYTLAERLGLKSEKLFEVAKNASGQCWAMTQYSPVPGLVDNVPSNNDYEPGFSSQMMLKDLKLSQEAAKNVGLETTIGHKAKELYQRFIDSGFGSKDFSAIIKMIANEQ
jgi:3-hydroxyisobutyrate dehydrogenase